MKLPTLVALALLAVAGCATTANDAAPRPNYYVMRHLQKAEGPDPGLSAQGQHYAGLLAEALADDPPAAVYVSTTRRARETAAVIAGRLHIAPKAYDPADTPALIAAASAEPGTVLIIGHSNTVPEIIERLGGIRPPDLTETDYGEVWRVYGPDRRTEKFTLGPGDRLDQLAAPVPQPRTGATTRLRIEGEE